MGDERDIKQLDQLFHQVSEASGGDMQTKMLLHGILTLLARAVERLEDLEDSFAKISSLTERVGAIEERFSSAFVSDDPDGHRRFHEEYIARTIEIRKIRVAITEKTLSALVWSALLYLGFSGWSQFLQFIKRG